MMDRIEFQHKDGKIVIFVETWANGKVLLTTRDSDVKDTWRWMCQHFPEQVQPLVDPEDLTLEDTADSFSVVVDPALVDIRFDLRSRSIGFFVLEEET